MTFSYETLGNASYLVVGFTPEETIVNYQMQMLVNNDIQNVVKATKQQKNDEIHIYYNITSKISLGQALQHNKISKKGLINLIEGALSAFQDSAEYQLPSSGILFDEDYVYVKPGSFEPSFIYLPTSNENTGVEALKKLILNLVVTSKVEVTNDNFVQLLLETVNDTSAGEEEMRKFCAKQKKEKSASVDQAACNSVPPLSPTPTMQTIPPVQAQSVMPMVESTPSPSASLVPPQQQGIQNSGIPQAPDSIKRKKERKKEKNKETSAHPGKSKFILLQIILIAILIGVVLTGVLQDKNGNMNYKYFGALVVVLAATDFIVYREMFVNNKEEKNYKKEKGSSKEKADKKKKKVVPPVTKKELPMKKPLPVKENVPVASAIPAQSVQPVQSAPQVQPIQPIPASQPAASIPYVSNRPGNISPQLIHRTDWAADEGNDDTVVLAPAGGAYLEFLENGFTTQIRLDKESVIVGKLSSQCDFAINNNKVSKMHAEFISRDGSYFVKDCNSTNGTYLNGDAQRIASNVEYPIHNGDRITLANVDLIFRC